MRLVSEESSNLMFWSLLESPGTSRTSWVPKQWTRALDIPHLAGETNDKELNSDQNSEAPEALDLCEEEIDQLLSLKSTKEEFIKVNNDFQIYLEGLKMPSILQIPRIFWPLS
jgi:hypothetical protein